MIAPTASEKEKPLGGFFADLTTHQVRHALAKKPVLPENYQSEKMTGPFKRVPILEINL